MFDWIFRTIICILFFELLTWPIAVALSVFQSRRPQTSKPIRWGVVWWSVMSAGLLIAFIVAAWLIAGMAYHDNNANMLFGSGMLAGVGLLLLTFLLIEPLRGIRDELLKRVVEYRQRTKVVQ